MKSVTQFLSEVKSEMAKVVWPTWSDLLGSTVVVMVIVAAFAVFLFFVDLGFSKLARFIFQSYGLNY
jgi:preprotein translocase subunit SecE